MLAAAFAALAVPEEEALDWADWPPALELLAVPEALGALGVLGARAASISASRVRSRLAFLLNLALFLVYL